MTTQYTTPTAGRPRSHRYLSLERLTIKDLPPHAELPAQSSQERPSLAQFLNSLLTELSEVDFDRGWQSCREWSPQKRAVTMPSDPANTTSNGNKAQVTSSAKNVSISVHQRVKPMEDKQLWLARTSYHRESDVTYLEFDRFLSHEHSLNEARYTPSVFDANELLAWSVQDLENILSELSPDLGVQKVQMSVFQMFHKMPEVAPGLSLLQDRVFHVLVITAHSYYSLAGVSNIPQSYTAQLPVDFESLTQSTSIKQKSHVKKAGRTERYHLPSGFMGETSLADEQKKRVGRKLTEGNYVSLERLRKCSKPSLDETTKPAAPPQDTEHHNRWDMMTLSTAKGITEIAPASTKQKETLKAVSADVEYVIKHIAHTRQNTQS